MTVLKSSGLGTVLFPLTGVVMLIPERAKKIIAYFLAVVSGVGLFAAAATVSLYFTVFSSSFHKDLFEKYGIYEQIEKSAVKALQENISKINAGTSGSEKQKEQLVSMVKKAFTPEMVRLNADSTIEGLIRYFKGEAQFLPDISIEPAGKGAKPVAGKTVQPAAAASGQALSGIDRISLNVILMYMDRNDMINTLSEVRLIVFVLLHAPFFLVLISVFFLLSGAMLAGRNIFRIFRLAAFTPGISAVASCLLLLGIARLYLPGRLHASPLTGYIGEDSLYGYIGSLTLRLVLILASFGTILLAAAFIIRPMAAVLPKHPIRRLVSLTCASRNPYEKAIAGFIARHDAVLAAAAMVLVFSVLSFSGFQAVENDFHAKDLGAALERLSGGSTYSKVIAARSEIIYSVEVRIADKQTGDPVGDVVVTLDGVLSDKAKKYSKAVPSDESGKARFSAAPGAFRLDFDKARFPQGYKIPASYPFEIRTAGITIITVHLEKIEGPKTGIAEMLVLGSDDKPLENLELTAAEVLPANGSNSAASSGKVFSITNKEGTAVFKLTEGRYILTFMEAGFPLKYLVPDPITIDIAGDTVSTCSLKLSPKPLPTAAPKKK